MKQLTIKKEGEFEYRIIWEENFAKLSGYLKELKTNAKKICIVTDTNVGALYSEAVSEEIAKAFDKVSVFAFPAGEKSKNLDTVKALYQHLIQNKFERNDLLLALGGGVTGDLTGFAAATYLRGIDFVRYRHHFLHRLTAVSEEKPGLTLSNIKTWWAHSISHGWSI